MLLSSHVLCSSPDLLSEDVDEGDHDRDRERGSVYDRDRDCHDDRGQLLDRGLLLLVCRWSAQYPHDPVRDEVR